MKQINFIVYLTIKGVRNRFENIIWQGENSWRALFTRNPPQMLFLKKLKKNDNKTWFESPMID